MSDKLPLVVLLCGGETDMPFQKGVCANPGGRPITKLPDGRSLAEVAREYSEQAVQTLVALLDAESEAVRLSAANSLLDRSFGKPKQTVDLDVRSDESVAGLLEAARRRAQAGATVQ